MENWGKIGKRKKDGVLKGGTFSTHEEEEKRRFGKNETFSIHWEWTSKQNRERSLKKEEKKQRRTPPTKRKAAFERQQAYLH